MVGGFRGDTFLHFNAGTQYGSAENLTCLNSGSTGSDFYSTLYTWLHMQEAAFPSQIFCSFMQDRDGAHLMPFGFYFSFSWILFIFKPTLSLCICFSCLVFEQDKNLFAWNFFFGEKNKTLYTFFGYFWLHGRPLKRSIKCWMHKAQHGKDIKSQTAWPWLALNEAALLKVQPAN